MRLQRPGWPRQDMPSCGIEERSEVEVVASQRGVFDALYASQGRFNLVAYPLSFLDMRIRRAWQMLPADSMILDVGCGSGNLVLRQGGFTSFRYVGVDVSTVGLVRAKQAVCARHSCSRFIQSFAERLPFEDSAFEGLFAISVVEHVPDAAAFLKDCARVLKPRGLFVLHTPSPDNQLTVDGFLRVFFPNVYTRRLAAVGHDDRRFIAPNNMERLLERHGFCGPFLVYYTDTLVEWLWEHAISRAFFALARRAMFMRSRSADAEARLVEGPPALGPAVRLYNSVLFPVVRLLCWPDRLIELTGRSGGYFMITRRC